MICRKNLTREKVKRIGNLKFVAELLKEGLLSSRVGKVLVDDLLEKKTESSLEALCAFLDSIGMFLENFGKDGGQSVFTLLLVSSTQHSHASLSTPQ